MDRQRLGMLQARKEELFKGMTKLHDEARRISNFKESRANENFLAQTEAMETKLSNFSQIIEEINMLSASADSEFVYDFSSLSAYEELFSRLKRMRNNILSFSTGSSEKVSAKPAQMSIKLPPLELPSFDGRTENWPLFFESFKTNVHFNTQLNDSQRVQYLIGRLKDNALKIIAGIIPTGDTYEIIWESLVKKYQDQRSLATFYLNNIFELKNSSALSSSLTTFIENYSASLAALKQLEIPDLADFIMLQCALKKIDCQTLQAFELSVRHLKLPTCRDFVAFIEDQIKILDRVGRNNSYTQVRSLQTDNTIINKKFEFKKRGSRAFVSSNGSAGASSCIMCKSNSHVVSDCQQFRKLASSTLRYELIKERKGCINCLSASHQVSFCKSAQVCVYCQRKHHSLLHFGRDNPVRLNSNVQLCSTSVEEVRNKNENRIINTRSTMAVGTKLRSAILLATAQVYAKAKGGINRVLRCLLDNGSQNNLITKEGCKTLGLQIIPLKDSFVKGVGSSRRSVLGCVHLDIESRIHPEHKYKLKALVVDIITDPLPSFALEKCDMGHLDGLDLADSTWNIPGKIDLIIGSQLFPYIYLGSRVESGTLSPPAWATTLGYVLMGDYPHLTSRTIGSTSLTAITLCDLVQKFWQLEELPQLQFLSPEETECENLFTASLTQEENGRFSVALPFTRDPGELGDSLTTARKRLRALDRKWKNTPGLEEDYRTVIAEYIDKGYLSKEKSAKTENDGYYIPHHAIVRPDKPMPRIVLDASAKTSTGCSLNDLLHTGPNLQTDLFLLLLEFRLFPVALTADIKQMYLQIEVKPIHRKYLRILFQAQDSEEINTFHFNRVPFGLKSSPYLAMRVIRQLADNLQLQFPEAAKVAASKLYMDDLVHSMPDENSAKKLIEELIKMFKSGCFDLIKWTSNRGALLENLSETHRSSINFSNEGSSLKVLGLSWEPRTDEFLWTTSYLEEKCTKRSILSVVARLYDVLGLVAPVVMYAKLLIKELWMCNVGWDDPPPENIHKRFSSFMQEFYLLETLRIPRHIGVLQDSIVCMVAFCDASMNGYGAVIYLHSIDAKGDITVRLLCAKSKVAPTRVVTLARLELCAALLMAKLVKTVREAFSSRIVFKSIYAFSDSMIALSWIHSSPHRWSVFVSNRIAQCHENLSPECFYHVKGSENPSDSLSRGLMPSQLIADALWAKGPIWLQEAPLEWPIKPFGAIDPDSLPEHRARVLASTAQIPVLKSMLYELAEKISCWGKLLKIIIYILHFIRKISSLSDRVANVMIAEMELIRAVQSVYFAEDLTRLKNNNQPSSKLHRLAVFVDEQGIIRIGGRLSRADLPYEAKHPVLLPKHDHVVDLIVRHYHVKHCHAGPGLLISILRQRYWILDARTTVRALVHRCNACFKVNPSHPTPKMADLPTCRVMEAKAFVHTGVDYAGPLHITLNRRRGQHSQKAYICLFVCLVTKAVHVELVSALTTEAFLDAFKRFISRRGPVSCMYSDNGTNFVGAKAQLDELYMFLKHSPYETTLREELLSHRITWKFIPPRAPHFGGMWEANIKSLKTHLHRVIGAQLLTYEELYTVLVQIECLMNSRPLTVLSSDPEPEVLTPAHFLMSTPLKSLPARDLMQSQGNLSCRKQLLDRMVQSFWKRWHLEYLNTLQSRNKWATGDNPVKLGTIVLIRQEDTPPLHWPLGIVVDIHPGADGIVRVATVRTRQGCVKRPIVKLYPIPSQ